MSVLDLVILVACIVNLVFSTGTVLVLITSYVPKAKDQRKSSARRRK